MIGADALRYDRARNMRIADGLAILLALVMPWSTSATAIVAVVWMIAAVPLLSAADVRRELSTAAGALPLLLLLLGAAGTLWLDGTWKDAFKGIDAFGKLLLLPLLFLHFRQSSRGMAIFVAYGLSCSLLLMSSYLLYLWPALYPRAPSLGVAVRNGPTQSGEFVTCIFPLLWILFDMAERRRFAVAAAIAVLIAAFLANIFFLTTSRTALVVMPVLLLLFGLRRLGLRGAVFLLAGGAVLAAAVWLSSPYLRGRIYQITDDLKTYEQTNERNSSGERVEFWKKSIGFIRAAPLIGHGTGSIPKLYREAAYGSGASAVDSTNPHNQTFTIAIQVGLAGAVILWAMWIAHLLLFRGEGLVAWIGLAVVVQNVVGSLFNSHLSDFVQGWVYVVGVGVAGGMMRHLKPRPPKAQG